MNFLVLNIHNKNTHWTIITKEKEIIKSGKIMYSLKEISIDYLFEEYNNLISQIEFDGIKIEAVLVNVPGVVNSDTSALLSNGRWLRTEPKVNLKYLWESHSDKEIFFMNDANSTALGSYLNGPSVGIDNNIYVTLRTGIGSGIIINGNLYKGSNWSAGEVGRNWMSGSTWEASLSLKTLSAMIYLSTGLEVDSYDQLSELANQHEEIMRIMKSWITEFSQGITILINSFNPKAILVDSPMLRNEIYTNEMIKEELSKHISQDTLNATEIIKIIDIDASENYPVYGILHTYLKDFYNK